MLSDNKPKVKNIVDDLSPTQKKVYLLLNAYGSLAVGDIAKRLKLSRSTASRTLNCLFGHAILNRAVSGRLIIYSINHEEVKFLESKIETGLKNKIQDFLESELLNTVFVWEKQSDPCDDTTAESVVSLVPSEEGYNSWVETHQIFINDATLFEEDKDSILVKVDLTTFYSEGNADDEGDVPEEEWESNSSTYYVRVQGENMEIEAME
ncbi:ArsR family transcriptional regulator [Coleofasciculus sp. G2-EDA-02]|uniref:ArsR family transcriptional regulator n=1 Tax=Coleofasciculus sp. G2-EDA-02 TaxID=3069529 RepID=UPI0032F900C5